MEDPFSVADRYLKTEGPKPRAWLIGEIREGGQLRALQICSATLEAHVWVVLDPTFEPHEGLAVFHAEELPILATKTAEEFRRIHEVKLAFGQQAMVRE